MKQKPVGTISPWEAMLEYDGQLKPGERRELSVIFIEAPQMPVRRRVSVEEFEADMRRAHLVRQIPSL